MNSIKIKVDATEMNKQMERSAKILADAAKKSQISIENVGKAFAKISPIDYSILIPSFSSYTANNPNYWKEFNKEIKMNYKDLKRDDTVYHCRISGQGDTYLFRFISGDRKQIINCDTGRVFDDCAALYDNMLNYYRLANLEEQCRFYNEFGYKDAKGRVWKVGDSNSYGDKILEFDSNSRGETIWIKAEYEANKFIWGSACRLDNYEGQFPVKKALTQRIQGSLDFAQELAKSSYMTIDQCRESISPTKLEKVHWFKRFVRKIV